ncbi:MAG: SpoIID/LytB domain-containing protein [Gaiellaceae bacterium]
MRRLLPLAVLAAVLALPPSAGADTLFVLKGRGWGHGVGMSQYGALGMAENGSSYRQILGHYYRNTSVERRGNPKVGVELASGRTSLQIGPSTAFRVSTGARNESHPTGSAIVRIRGSRIKVTGIEGTFESPATFAPGNAPIRLGSTAYSGTLVVSIRSGRLRAVNRLRMEGYLRGVVPRESPASWPPAALQAQAVAARSYALYGLVNGLGSACGGAFCPDTRHQVYGGLPGDSRTDAAVAATAREVVVDRAGNVAQTFFHSSSGGRTANSEDIWTKPVSYLKSVPDRADLNSANPNRLWRVFRTPAQLRSQLALPRTPNDATVRRDSSDRVKSIEASGPGWVTPAPGGDSLRWRMGLKSNRFWLGVLRLTPARSRLEWRQRSTVSGLVRNVGNSTLQRRRAGGGWTTLRSANGPLGLRIRPRVTTWYRLGPPAFGTTVRIKVQPRLRITTVRTRSLRGTMGPKRAGTTVSVQKLVKVSWKTVANATVKADGTWRAGLHVSHGTYRAFAAPGNGLVGGASPAIKVAA